MHTAITKAFKRYHLFGFTGTPIFAENAGTGGNPQLRTTEQAFGDQLHTYTIVDAINDKNVLPFRIDYVNTIKLPDGLADKQVSAIDTERALLAPERIAPGRRLHPGALRPEDQAQLSTTRSASKRRRAASTRCSRPPRSTPPSATTAEFASAAGGPAAGPAAQGRPHLLLRRQRGRSTTTASTRRTSRPTRLDAVVARLPRRRDRRTTTPCSARASTPRPTSSRTTTRTSRCG